MLGSEMASYEVRYLKPDGSSKEAIVFAAASDAEAKAYIIDHHGRRATELWRDGQLVQRRVSPKFEAAARGIYPSCCRWPALSHESLEQIGRSGGPLNDVEFDAVGRHSQGVLGSLHEALAPHSINLWTVGTGPPRPQPRQAVRYTCHAFSRSAGRLSGMDICAVFSHVTDGPDVAEEICDLLNRTLEESYVQLEVPNTSLSYKVNGLNHLVEVQGEWCKSIGAYWMLDVLSPAGGAS